MSKALHTALESALSAALNASVYVQSLARIAGGASQETWRLDAVVGGATHALILRRPLGGSIYAAALALPAEYAVLSAAYAAGAPTPRPCCLLPDLLGRPATLVERLSGESIGRKIVKDAAFVKARAALPAQLGQALAAIHNVDLDAAGLHALLDAPPPGLTPAQHRIAQISAALDQLDEPHPALEIALRWLIRHEPPPPERLVLVHGDFRLGNLLVDANGLVAVIDWEFAHLGDPAEDLTWILLREWRFGVPERRLGGIAQPDAFFATYCAQRGTTLDAKRLAYWEILGNVWWAIGTLNQTRRHLSGQEANLEFASLGRRCAEMELEALDLIAAQS